MKPRWLPWLILAFLFLGAGGVVVWEKIRGYRNRNPGNIKRDDNPAAGLKGTAWRGLALTQTDPVFWQFSAPEWGIRALRKTLETYSTKYGARTIQAVITRYAPGTENDTASYIRAVADSTGFDPQQELIYPRDLEAMVRAIIRHENGVSAATLYPADVITLGLTLP